MNVFGNMEYVEGEWLLYDTMVHNGLNASGTLVHSKFQAEGNKM